MIISVLKPFFLIMEALGILWKIFTMQTIRRNIYDAIYESDVFMHLLSHWQKWDQKQIDTSKVENLLPEQNKRQKIFIMRTIQRTINRAINRNYVSMQKQL